MRLTKAATGTTFGRDHGFSRIGSIEDYRKAVPLRTYEDLWNDYLRHAYPVLENVTWPGRIPYFALTSGTTQGGTKYIPVTKAMLRANYAASERMLAYRYVKKPSTRLLDGKMFFLGGSTALEDVAPGVKQGDLSGIVAMETPRWSRPFTFPPLELALESDWDRKLARLAEASVREPITLIGGVPTWLLVLFDRVRQITGKSTVSEVWPRLQVVVHGGVKFDPYRDAFAEAIGNPSIAYQDAYACSEGFIAFGDPLEPGLLRLCLDHFYEFIPADEVGSPNPRRLWLDEVEVGVNYAIAVSTCAGMWSHVIGDTVRFERLDPPMIVFTGRTKYSLSAFGEHLISEEVEGAIADAASATGSIVRDWHVGPVFQGAGGHHVFLVEFSRDPSDLGTFRDRLDDSLSARNDDYRAHRAPGVGLPSPEVVALSPGSFESWMRSRGKLGGQHKLPRMDGSGAFTAGVVASLSDRVRARVTAR